MRNPQKSRVNFPPSFVLTRGGIRERGNRYQGKVRRKLAAPGNLHGNYWEELMGVG